MDILGWAFLGFSTHPMRRISLRHDPGSPGPGGDVQVPVLAAHALALNSKAALGAGNRGKERRNAGNDDQEEKEGFVGEGAAFKGDVFRGPPFQ